MLRDNEVIVWDETTGKDVVATVIMVDHQIGRLWAKIGPGNVIVSDTDDIIERNTKENIKKVCEDRLKS